MLLGWIREKVNQVPAIRVLDKNARIGSIRSAVAMWSICLLSSCHQPPRIIGHGAYEVDESVIAKLDGKVKSEDGFEFGSMDFKMFENDTVVRDTYDGGKPVDHCLTSAYLQGDTIIITAYLGKSAGFGYRISLFKDSCIAQFFAKTDFEIYKYRKTDSPAFSIWVPCQVQKLTLASNPAFKKGEIVEGIIALTSDDYYQAANGKQSKFRIQITGYFRTQPLATMEDYHTQMKAKYR